MAEPATAAEVRALLARIQAWLPDLTRVVSSGVITTDGERGDGHERDHLDVGDGPGSDRVSRVPGAPSEPISVRLGRRTAGVREDPQDGLPARSLRRADSGEACQPAVHLPAPAGRSLPSPVAGPAGPGDDAGVEVGPGPTSTSHSSTPAYRPLVPALRQALAHVVRAAP